jgi:hypothetical protein
MDSMDKDVRASAPGKALDASGALASLETYARDVWVDGMWGQWRLWNEAYERRTR